MIPTNLNHNGFDSPDGIPFDKATEFRVKQLASIIPLLIQPRKTVNKSQTSYGMKHVFSTILRNYCNGHHSYMTNGEFIAAMITAGYEPIRLKEGGPNCYFKGSIFREMLRAPHFYWTDRYEDVWEKKFPNFYEFRKAMMSYKDGTFFTPSEEKEQVDWFHKDSPKSTEEKADKECSAPSPF